MQYARNIWCTPVQNREMREKKFGKDTKASVDAEDTAEKKIPKILKWPTRPKISPSQSWLTRLDPIKRCNVLWTESKPLESLQATHSYVSSSYSKACFDAFSLKNQVRCDTRLNDIVAGSDDGVTPFAWIDSRAHADARASLQIPLAEQKNNVLQLCKVQVCTPYSSSDIN